MSAFRDAQSSGREARRALLPIASTVRAVLLGVGVGLLLTGTTTFSASAIQDQFEDAADLDVERDGSVSHRDELEDSGRPEFYRFQATKSGMARIQLLATSDILDTVLTVYDSDGRQVATNDDFSGLGSDSQVDVRVNEGSAYYIEAGSYNDSGGGFRLSIEIVEGADPLSTATPIEFDDDGDAEADGRIEEEGGLVYYRIDSPYDGQMIIMLMSDGGDSDMFLRIYDDEFRVVNFNDDGPIGGTDSQVTIRVVEDGEYYIEASTYNNTTGRFSIEIDGKPGEDPLDDAVVLEFNADDKATGTGEIEDVASLEFFSFVAPVDGEMTVVMEATDLGSLDTFLTVFDGDFRVIDTNDDAFDENTNSAITINTVEGETYFIRASGYSSSTGPYKMTVVTGGMPSPFDDAVEIELNAAGRTAKRGEIGGLISEAYYLYSPDEYSDVTVTMLQGMSSEIDPYLAIFDSDRLELMANDDFGETTDSKIVFRARPGESYYIRASGVEGSSGSYLLTVRAEAVEDPLDRPTVIRLDDDGRGEAEADFGVVFGEDGYRFISTITGRMTIILAAESGSGLDTKIKVLDSNREIITENDDAFDFNNDAAVTIDVERGDTIHILASSYNTTAGDYRVRIMPGEIPSPFDEATDIRIGRDGTAETTGTLRAGTEGDYYRFAATEDGSINIVQRSSGGSGIDTYLYVYDERQNLIDSSDDAFADNTDSAVIVSADAGDVFYIRAAAYDESGGEYSLTITQGELATPFDDAVELDFDDGATSAEVSGEIGELREKDYYIFEAPITGELSIAQLASAASDLDSELYVYDSDRKELASNDDGFPDTLDSLVKIRVRAGESYYIAAGGLDTSIGAYDLELSWEMVPDPFEAAEALRLRRSAAEVEGELREDGDVAFYKITPDGDGRFTIRVESTGGVSFDTVLTVYDDGQDEIAENDDASDFETDSELTVGLDGGQDYFIRVSSYDESAGTFTLTVRPAE